MMGVTDLFLSQGFQHAFQLVKVMKKAPPPHNEVARLAAMERYGILDTPPDAVPDGIAQAAADLCETPIALISLIDPTRQWFKA